MLGIKELKEKIEITKTKITPSGMPLKRTESAFFEASIFEKSTIN